MEIFGKQQRKCYRSLLFRGLKPRSKKKKRPKKMISEFFASHCFFFFAKSFYFRNFVSTIGFFNIKHSCRLATSRPLKSSRTCHTRTDHRISRIKSSFELLCALVWDVTHFQLKTWIFGIRSTASGAFFTYLVIDKDYFWNQNDDRGRIPGRNLPVLNFASHLTKPWTDRFAHVNGKQLWPLRFPGKEKNSNMEKALFDLPIVL